jgi:hypothetical protein
MEEKQNKGKNIGGLVFVGCMFIGAGIGMAMGQVAVGGAIGMGVGFLGMAAAWMLTKNG